MGRRTGFLGVVTAIARESARQQRAAEVARRRQVREMEASQRRSVREAAQAEREWKKTRAQEEKESRQEYIASRNEESENLSAELEEKVEALRQILPFTLTINDTISFDSLRIHGEFHSFNPPSRLLVSHPEPDKDRFLQRVWRPTGLKALMPGAKKRYAYLIMEAEKEYETAKERWIKSESDRTAALKALSDEYNNERAAFHSKKAQRNAEIDDFELAYRSADPDAIVAYCNMVLERSEYPEGFPQEFRIAYAPESKQLVIEYQLPPVEVIPKVAEYRYVKNKDQILEKARKDNEIKDLYQDIVAAVALRTIHEVYEADQCNYLNSVCFNGYVETVDSATGRDTRPHLISIRVTRERFDEIDLARADKRACLRNLGAQVSSHAAEAQAVKPVVEFDMVDRRFVDQSDVLANLESRPNLMELNPFEFEHLVANLFKQMGLESKLTRSSKDGGVDCVAFDARPVLGGKVIIQAKRYRNTVGVSAARDLYGTMINEGANKGILVATSGYGPDAFDFCKDKPIELIDGGGLLYLLQQVGVEARIVFLEE